jgi:hypothetical protein
MLRMHNVKRLHFCHAAFAWRCYGSFQRKTGCLPNKWARVGQALAAPPPDAEIVAQELVKAL